jgi:hypothetical protein
MRLLLDALITPRLRTSVYKITALPTELSRQPIESRRNLRLSAPWTDQLNW